MVDLRNTVERTAIFHYVDPRGGSQMSKSSARRNFDEQPLLVFWQLTRAPKCSIGTARTGGLHEFVGDELSHGEGRKLIDELASMQQPHPILVLTGDDCFKRPDIIELVTYASERAVPVAVAPSVSTGFTDANLHALRQHGVKTVSLRLDGATALTHDALHGVTGHFDDTLTAVATLKRCGFTVQINSTVIAPHLEELPDIAVLMHELGVDVWELEFSIARADDSHGFATSPQENEEVCHFLVDAARYGFTVRTVDAPFFRRVVAQRRELEQHESMVQSTGVLYQRLRRRLVQELGESHAPPRTTMAATRDGKGIIYIAANGDVFPSRSLALRLGNVRNRSLLDIYRTSPLLQLMRDASFSGMCGACEYKQLCGGSRARAYASSRNPLGTDPGCLRASPAA